MTQRPAVHGDYETRSAADLLKVGAHRYAEDPTTEIICFSYQPGGEALRRADRWGAFCRDVDRRLRAGARFVCHNATFERAMWNEKADHELRITPEMQDCTLARAAACGLPASLDNLAKALRTKVQKDTEGYRLMLKMCKPKTRDPLMWHESPEEIERLQAYCDQDVLTESGIDKLLPALTERERRVWELDQHINDRGVQIDVDMVRAAELAVEEAVNRANQRIWRLTNGAVKKVTEAAKIVAWINKQDVPCTSIAAGEHEDLILGAELFGRPQIEEVIVLRAASAKAFKFKAMLDSVCRDGRVRGSLRYHATIQGRWAGAGVQFHNMKRVETDEDAADVALTVSILKSGKTTAAIVDELDLLFPASLETLSICTRSSVIAAPGHRLIGGDFSNIEGRVNAWLAGQKDKLEAFRRYDAGVGPDLYRVTAAKIAEIDVAQVTRAQRQEQGKVPELACLAPDTLVFTNCGLVPIKDVEKHHLLWDGVEWVGHSGVMDRGSGMTVDVNGVRMTPDHGVLVGGHWLQAQEVLSSRSWLRLAQVTASENLKSLVLNMAPSGALGVYLYHALAASQDTSSTSVTCGGVQRLDAVIAPRVKSYQQERSIGATPTSWKMSTIDTDCLAEYQRPTIGVITQTMPGIKITASVELNCLNLGEAIDVLFSHTSSLWKAGTTRFWSLIERILTETTHPETSDLYRVLRTLPIVEASRVCNDASPSWRQLYDIANAGPRNRFMVYGLSGPMIVHNCGYQGSLGAFKKMGAKYGVRLSDVRIRQIVAGWRDTNPAIVASWAVLQEAAIEAVGSRGCVVSVLNDRIRYVADKGFLYCKLPSGRVIHYPSPTLAWKSKTVVIDEDEITFNRNTVSYWTSEGGRWMQKDLYGGAQCAHVVSGIARDILVEGMFRVEAAGYPLVLTIHDEGLSEVPLGFGSKEEYLDLLLQPIEWMGDCPISASTWEGPRYIK